MAIQSRPVTHSSLSSLKQMADSRMRVAVAGTNALALMIASYIVSETSHQLIVLSRFVSLLFPLYCFALPI